MEGDGSIQINIILMIDRSKSIDPRTPANDELPHVLEWMMCLNKTHK